jgi:hypothetical protein
MPFKTERIAADSFAQNHASSFSDVALERFKKDSHKYPLEVSRWI